MDLDAAEEKAKAKSNGQAKSGGTGKRPADKGQDSPRVPVDLTKYPRAQKAFANITGDRSKDLARIVVACVDSGLTKAQIRWVVDLRTDLVEKLDELGHDDVDRLYDKIDEDRRNKAQGKAQEQEDAAEHRHKRPLDDVRHGADTAYFVGFFVAAALYGGYRMFRIRRRSPTNN